MHSPGMSNFVTGNPEHDFFEQNPELQYITAFRILIEEKGKKDASKLMWCIYMIEDPKSKIFRMPRNEKISEVTQNYYPKLKEDDILSLGKLYAEYCLEKEEYLYNIQIEKLDQLTTLLQKLSIDIDSDLSKYIRIMDKLPKIWDGLDKVKKNMIDKMNKSGLRGGAQRSSREKRL